LALLKFTLRIRALVTGLLTLSDPDGPVSPLPPFHPCGAAGSRSVPPFLTSGISRITPCYSTVPHSSNLAGCVRGFPIKVAWFAPRQLSFGDLVFDLLFLHRPLAQLVAEPRSSAFQEPIIVQKGSGLGTFSHDAQPAFAFFPVSPPVLPDGTNPQRRSDVGDPTSFRSSEYTRRLILSRCERYSWSFGSPSFLLTQKHPLYADAFLSYSDTDNPQSAGCTQLAPRTFAAVSNGPASLYHQA
jgi:hypothetical protein